MKLLRYTLTYPALLLALLATLVFAGYRALTDSEPQLSGFEKVGIDDIRRIKQLLLEANTPGLNDGVKSLTLNERDINLGIGYLAPATFRVPKDTFAHVQLEDNRALVTASVPTKVVTDQLLQLSPPENHFWIYQLEDRVGEDWLNLAWNIEERNGVLEPGLMRIGSITLSKAMSQSLLDRVMQELQQDRRAAEVLSAWSNLRDVDIGEDALAVQYVLPTTSDAALGSYQALILSPGEQELIQVYSDLLAEQKQSGPLVLVLKPLFQEAERRSIVSGDPVAENRAVLLAVAKVFGGDQLLGMLKAGEFAAASRLKKPYTIYGRTDLAQHLAISAGLTLIADENFADLLGIDKEMADLTMGKTISAWDLLADRTGIRLATFATATPKQARSLQQRFSAVDRDGDLLPDLGVDFAPELDRFTPADIEDLTLLAELSLDELPLYKK